MKQVFLAIAIFLMASSSKRSEAQTNADVAFNRPTSSVILNSISHSKTFRANNRDENVKRLENFVRTNKVLSKIEPTQVNIKAVRHFTRSYKNIQYLRWIKTEGGFTANFFSDGVYTKVVYDEKGRWFYNLLTYPEVKLASDIRHRVKSHYYDNYILSVDQFKFYNHKTVYLIRMQDKESNIVTLKLSDDEMTDITPRTRN